MDYILEKDNNSYIEYPLNVFLQDKKDHFIVNNNELFDIKENKTINSSTFFDYNDRSYLYLKNEPRYFERTNCISIGNNQGDIVIPELNNNVIITNYNIILNNTSDDIYFNGSLLKTTVNLVKVGDIIQLANIRIVIDDKYISIIGNCDNYQIKLIEISIMDYRFDNFPNYTKSPRVIKRVDEDDISIVNPPAKATQGAKGLITTFLPSFMMLIVMVGLRFVVGGGIAMMLMSGAMCGVTLITNTVKYFSDRKENKITNKKRDKVYNEYLLKIRKKIYEKQLKNKESYSFTYPSLDNISKMINEYSNRIYERSSNDNDFLIINAGYYDGPSKFEIKVNENEVELDKDDLAEKALSIQKEFSTNKHLPYLIDLKKSHLGLIGNKKEVHSQLHNYLSQLTFLHSYHDLEIVFVYNSRYKDEFDYVKWYPHLNIQALNIHGTIYDDKMRNQVLGSIYQILNERKSKADNKTSFLPHLLFIIDDADLVYNHSIMEFLQVDQDKNNLDYSIIYTSETKSDLLENIKTIITIDDYDYGKVLTDDRIYTNKQIKLQRTDISQLEKNARTLSQLNHELVKTSQIPTSINYLEMYNCKHVEELDVTNRWSNHHIYQSISVPIGVRGQGEIVNLDLHEKAHGPHGLVAGTTGSGKSETVQTYILSLATNFHPYEVGFLLIDYKGGGMANLFKDLPHLLGTITNLDGGESQRALISIKSELKRRQRIFEENSINNINAYTKLFDNGDVKEPLPHLFIISDEFAELKKEQPEFMKELVSTARVGRSLGVHLILATQKPTGVVDDQIWSNSRFKLCLKVQNEADSKEMLKTPDAAHIVETGRAYLQVGNNEIYELFQSAYSGGVYSSEEDDKSNVDNRVYLINELGQGELINQDLSSIQDESINKASELDKIIEYISTTYKKMDTVEVKKPWLPSLPTSIVNEYNEVKDNQVLDLHVQFGLIDMPEMQQQKVYELDLIKDGIIAFYSASGYGKSMFLVNVVINLAVKNSPKDLNVYIIDFGNGALLQLNQLVHVADYINYDDEEKFDKFINLISEEVKTRKQKLNSLNAQNFEVYNQLSEEKMNAIVIAFDQFDILKEKGVDVENFFSKLIRDCLSLGIYIVLTVSRLTDLKFATANQIKNRIVGYMYEPSDVLQIIGHSDWKLTDTRGRALVKDKGIHMSQLYLPFEFKDGIDYISKLNRKIEDINKANDNYHLQGISTIPDELSLDDFDAYKTSKDYDIYLGLDKDKVEWMGIDITNDPLVIIGHSHSGKTNSLELVLNQIKDNIVIFDNKSMKLNKYRDKGDYYYETTGYQEGLTRLRDLVQQREESFNEAFKANNKLIPMDYYASLDNYYYYIDDVNHFSDVVSNAPDIATLIRDAINCNIYFFVTLDSTKLLTASNITAIFKEGKNYLQVGKTDQFNILNIPSSKQPQNIGDGILIIDTIRTQIKVAKATNMKGGDKDE